MCGLQGNAYSDDTYQLNGKVLINGNWYSRMLHYGRGCYGAGMCYCAALNGVDTTTYYIRQDTAQKKVWIYIQSSNSDTIFLDFNLHVGDTIDGRKEYWAQLWGNDFAIVDSIDSVLIGTQYRISYNYSYQGFPNNMIEGIGPTHGLFYPANQGYDHMEWLNIFSQNNQVFYPNYSPDTSWMMQYCHDFTSGIAEPNQIAYSILPNPATTTVTINFGNTSHRLNGGMKVQLCNTLGEVLKDLTLPFDYAQGGSQSERSQGLRLDVSSLRAGIYFITVTDEEGRREVRKIVKM